MQPLPVLKCACGESICGEYSSEKVTAGNFGQLAEEAGLGQPLYVPMWRQ